MVLKSKLGTPLETSGLVDKHHLAKLRALSVTTVEELLGLVASDPAAVNRFMEGTDLPQLQADAGMQAKAHVMADVEIFRESEFAKGARPPAGIEIEEEAKEETFQSYFAAAAPQIPAGEPGTGANLMECFGPIRHQQNRGTCVAHACCALLECHWNRTAGEELDLSEQFLYWNAKRNDGDPQEEGTLLEVAIRTVVSDGICMEETWPYNPDPTPGNEGQGPPPEGAEVEASQRAIGAAKKLEGRSSRAIRDALESGRPVALSIPVYTNWSKNPAANATGLIPMPLPHSAYDGGHAMCAIGFDFDEEFTGGGYFVLRNSWGAGWAPQSPRGQGHGLLPFEYMNKYGWEAFTMPAARGVG